MRNDRTFMTLAIKKAKEGIKSGQTPFGACIVKNGDVISCSHNNVWNTMDVTAHAEIIAIRNACGCMNTVDLTDCTIYSTCEPCPMCFSACHWAKISRIIYGTRIEDARAIGFNELTIPNQKLKSMGGSPLEIVGDFMREENMELFNLWYSLEDRKVY